VGLGLAGALLLAGAWQLAASARPDLPSPSETWSQLHTLLSSPFHNNGPNDKGLFLHLGISLGKVFMGFGLAALVGIPAGFLIGASHTASKAFNPLVQLFRPVSPLAWFPIFLVLLKDSARAGVLTIGITALWPVLVNTTFGVAGIPQDHKDVARVFKFSRPKYVRHVLMPYSMTSIITGLRLSMGIGWMVIVAAEMLSSPDGIGSFVWFSYNNNDLASIISAILIIGLVGLTLDFAFHRLARRFDYAKAA
jgi:nitrate/nitrite transport system permease protein